MVKIQGSKIVELCEEVGLDINDVTNIRITPIDVYFTYLEREANGLIFTDRDTGRIVESVKSVPIVWDNWMPSDEI